LVELQNKYKAQGVKIVAISILEEKGAKPQDEIDQRGYKFITGVKGEAVAEQYGVQGTPTTFFINRHNEVVFATSSSDVKDPRFELAIREMIKNR
jgi:thioredoxin-related protein